MDLDLNEVQLAVKESYHRFFDEEGVDAARRSERDGLPDRLHRRLAETGAYGMAVPTDLGGGGGGLTEVCVVCEEAGAQLAPVMLVETAVVARLLTRLHAGEDLVRPVLEGTRRVTLALRPAVGEWAVSVPYGPDADALVALRGDRLMLYPAELPGIQAVDTLAGASCVADCQLDDDGAVSLANGGDAVATYDGALAEWRLLTAATLVGIAQRCLDMASAYAAQRHQFGRPIGSFQSIAHSLANVAVAVDGARLLVYEAAWFVDEQSGRAPGLAAMAYCFAAETALNASSTGLHCHGGYGFMREYDIQLYYRRALFLSMISGGVSAHLDVVADRILPASAESCDGLRH